VRVEAQLARRGDADAVASIVRQAAGPCDRDQEVRLAALSALLNMNAEQAVPILQEVPQSRDECSVELRRRAVFLISQKMTSESVDILLDLAHRNPDPDSEVREQAIFWLHQVQTPEALDALESILIESEDPEIQERAIFAISQRSDDRRAIEILKRYAERTDIAKELRANAIFWISQNPDAGGATYLIELYSRLEDEELKERVLFGISQSPSAEGMRWLLERVGDRRESVEIRKNALFWVGQMGGLQAAELQDLYHTLDDMEMKLQVIFVASQASDGAAIDFLMEVARSEPDSELRRRALFWRLVREVEIVRTPDDRHRSARDFGEVTPGQAVEFLLSLAYSGATDHGAKDAILPATLADVDDTWQELLAMARDRTLEQDVRTNTLFWLGQEAATAGTQGLADVALDVDEDQEIRNSAIFALSQRAPRESVPILIEVARSGEQAETRRTAMFWLAQSGDERVVAFFEEILLGRVR
jgi:HEAT repeat protein